MACDSQSRPAQPPFEDAEAPAASHASDVFAPGAGAIAAADEMLKLDNQLCFPLYAASREITKRYTPLLSALDLTYPQYLTMMVLWEERSLTVKELGARLFLDSGTLTPLLKKLEAKGLVTRSRNASDERKLDIAVTQAGMALRSSALAIPQAIAGCVQLPLDEAQELKRLLDKLLASLAQDRQG